MNHQPTETRNAWQRRLSPKAICRLLLQQWLIIGIGISCVLAYYFPNVAKHGGVIRAEYSILYGVVAFIFLVSGMNIAKEKFAMQMLNFRAHIIVQGISFLLVPAIVVGIVHLIYATDKNHRIDEAVLAGYIFVACLPTTIASNVAMTREAGGDESIAVVEVLVGNLLGPFITPGWTVALLPKSPAFEPWRHASNIATMYRQVFQALGLSVLLPLVLGQILRWSWPEQVKKIVQKFYLPRLSTFGLVLLSWTTFSTCFATGALQSMTKESIIFTAFFNIGLYLLLTLLCYYLCRPPAFVTSCSIFSRVLRPIPPVETIAVCFCGAAKTTALSIPLLYAMYATNDLFLNAKMSVPVILYTTEQVFCAHFIVHIFRSWLRKSGKTDICPSPNEEPQCEHTVEGPLPSDSNHDTEKPFDSSTPRP